MKKAFAVVLASFMLVSVLATANAAPKPVKLFEDPAGDADNTQGLGASIPGGFDLVSGTIQKVSKTEVEFVVTHADMPPTGSVGEAFRLIWGLTVGTEQYEMTIKSLDVGKPDVVSSAMTQNPNGVERVGQVYQGVARLEQCDSTSLGITWSQCHTQAYYEAIFDPAAMTVTWRVPLADMKAKAGTVIAGGAGSRATTGCQICWVAQYAERSLTSASPPHTIVDAAQQVVSYKIPK